MTTVVQASANQLSTRVDDEAVILDLDASVYFSLDPLGARVLELLAQPRKIEDVLASVVAEFEVDERTARADLLALIGELRWSPQGVPSVVGLAGCHRPLRRPNTHALLRYNRAVHDC